MAIIKKIKVTHVRRDMVGSLHTVDDTAVMENRWRTPPPPHSEVKSPHDLTALLVGA